MEINLQNRQKTYQINEQQFRENARKILNALECPEGELSLVLVDDEEIAQLNAEYLGRTGPTNVIAFPMTEGAFGSVTPGLLGDVVISTETVKAQADDGGFTLEELLDFYLIHGILHLLGYDHVTSEDDAAVMDAKTNELWHMLGHRDT